MPTDVPISQPLKTAPYSRPLLITAGLLGILSVATLALWAHYGTAVFYEMILAGMAACL